MEGIKNDTVFLTIPVDLPEPEPINEVVMNRGKEIPATLPTKDPYFICEITMIAGLRKKPMSAPQCKNFGKDVYWHNQSAIG